MDEVVTGKLQFIDHLNSEMDFYPLLNRAMNFATSLNPSNYQMKYLSPGETLIREGESSDHVFILKKGMLMASKTENNKEVILGPIHPGEFVGEMGFLNNTKRVATVKAVQESQVVSIPVEIFDTVIFKRPSWAKLILTTISKRLSTTLKKQEPKAE
jgi:CRP/FNR family cyclic AMP-dependent transcriptional regulator